MPGDDKPLVWLHGEIKTPPLAAAACIEAGFLLRRLQRGELLGLPHSHPLPNLAPRCHELRRCGPEHNWRVIYRIDPDTIVIVEVFNKTTRATPPTVIATCQERLRRYHSVEEEHSS